MNACLLRPAGGAGGAARDVAAWDVPARDVPVGDARGGDDGTRTHNPLVANQVLYQLSYVPGVRTGRPNRGVGSPPTADRSEILRSRAGGWPRWIRTTDLTLIRRTL